MKMKTLFAIIISTLLLVSTAGCHTSNTNEERIADDDEVLLIFDLNTKDEIYQISMDFIVDEKIVGRAGTRNANSTPFAKDERIYYSIVKGVDLNKDLDISKLSLQFYVADFINDFGEPDDEYKIENEIKLVAGYGNVYYITIAGDKENGYFAFLKPQIQMRIRER